MNNLANALVFADLVLPTGTFSGLHSSRSLDFGEARQDTTVRKRVTIINDTGEILVNMNVSVRGATFWFNPSTFTALLPAGGLCYLDVEFTPTQTGHFVGFATVMGDDSTGTQAVTIRLEGRTAK